VTLRHTLNEIAASPSDSKPETKSLAFVEIALVLVRLDHVARFIEDANRSMM
jgi:hypothetical protein